MSVGVMKDYKLKLMLVLSLKCFYYLNQNQNPKTREYRIPIQMTNNPAPHVNRVSVLWLSRPNIQITQPPSCVMTTGV